MMKECMIRPLKVGFEEFIIGVDFKIGTHWGDMDDSEEFDFDNTEAE
jgi:hypothetical protein